MYDSDGNRTFSLDRHLHHFEMERELLRTGSRPAGQLQILAALRSLTPNELNPHTL